MARQRLGELDERIGAMRRARDELGRLLAQAPAGSDRASYCSLIEHRPEEAGADHGG